LEEIFDAYSSKKTGHEWYYTSNFPTSIFQNMTEVWISGKIVLISLEMWNSLVVAVGGRSQDAPVFKERINNRNKNG